MQSGPRQPSEGPGPTSRQRPTAKGASRSQVGSTGNETSWSGSSTGSRTYEESPPDTTSVRTTISPPSNSSRQGYGVRFYESTDLVAEGRFPMKTVADVLIHSGSASSRPGRSLYSIRSFGDGRPFPLSISVLDQSSNAFASDICSCSKAGAKSSSSFERNPTAALSATFRQFRTAAYTSASTASASVLLNEK